MLSLKTMQPRERVLATFAHSEPDRVPINYLWNVGIHERLKQHFGVQTGDDLLKALNVDFRGLCLRYTGPRLHPEASPEADMNVCPEWGFRTRWVDFGCGGFNDYCEFPLKDASDEEVEAWPFPSPDAYGYDHMLADARRYHDAGYAVSYGNPGIVDVLNQTGMLFGVEDTLLRLTCEDEVMLDFIDRRLAVQFACAQRALESAGGLIDFFWIGEDLGTQLGPMVGMDFFRNILKPRHQRFIDLARAYDLPVMVHSCGSSSWAFDEFIEMGVSVIDTLQPEAANMAPAYLKEKFGDRLTFHGCISTAGALSRGSAEDVRKDTAEILEIMKPGGGYCLSPTHQIQDNSPTENVLAMYETALECGRYR